MNTKTKATAKQIPAITEDLKQAVKLYIIAKAHRKSIQPIVWGYQSRILAEKQYKLAQEWRDRYAEHNITDQPEVITNPDHSYLMEDEDMREYLLLLHQEHIKHGFMVEMNYCPLLTAESQEIDAENLILDCSEYITSIKRASIWNQEHRRKMIDLTISFVLAQCPEITKESTLDMIKLPAAA